MTRLGPDGNLSARSMAAFLVVGGLSTALHYLLAALGVVVLGLPVVLASSLGFALSALANYLLNARWTFRSAAAHGATAPRFVATCSAGLLLNVVLLSLLLSLGMPVIPSQILTTLGVLIWNYIVNGLWTFKNRPR
ncbi:GtrA family protein [Janthinobacterium fluminis]|uniref:GtrA family protein n=1 Tax=Janthinobacterium fluminis TaxID=2987524 RepID=A0ABT5JYX3_9BURK|nr:GtrA family protein [Janthinobacterium fluminis]MDC8757686.1 GtrA family protein [Janthinobacterium fluminis]